MKEIQGMATSAMGIWSTPSKYEEFVSLWEVKPHFR